MAPLFVTIGTASAQWSIGISGGAGYDHGWTGNAHGLGTFVERRVHDSVALVVRLGAHWLAPIERVYGELSPAGYGSEGNTTNYVEHLDRTGLSLEVKWPFLVGRCEQGYHRGAYLLAGVGWEHARVRRLGTPAANTVGGEPVNATVERLVVDRWLGRSGLGVQYGFRWGSPFAEAQFTLAPDPYAGVGKWLLPGSLGVQVGYRYTFRKH